MKLKDKKGFSIIELSVSLIIIGVIVLAAMSSLQAIGENMAATKTDTKLDKMSNAIIDNIISAGSTTSVVANASRDLRLPSKDDVAALFYEMDGYGNNFDYIPAQSMLDKGGAENICTTNETKFTLHIKEKGTDTYAPMSHIAFVIISKGANLTKDYDNSTTGIVKLDRTGRNDDMFRYVTLDELKYRAGCSVARNRKLEILVNELPPLVGNSMNRVFTTPLMTDPDSYLKQARFCVDAENEDSSNRVRSNITFATQNGLDEMEYPLFPRDGIVKSNCYTTSSDGVTGLGAELLITRKPGGKPGTYKFNVVVISIDDRNYASQSYVMTVLD